MADIGYTCDDGAVANMNSVTGKAATPIGAGYLRLYTSPTAGVSKATVIGSLVEASFTGYAAIALSSATWAAATVAAHVAGSQYTAQTFTCTGAGATQQIYGWAITDAGKTKLYVICPFAAGPYPITSAGDSVTVTPGLSDQSLN